MDERNQRLEAGVVGLQMGEFLVLRIVSIKRTSPQPLVDVRRDEERRPVAKKMVELM